MEATKATPAKRRRRRWLVALLLLVALPLLLGGGAWLYLSSAAGEARLKQQVLEAVGASLAGKLEAGALELDGGKVVLTGLKLFTPEGELVAVIARVEADVDLAALAAQRVHLTRVDVFEPKLFLVEDERGWNLARALASRGAPTVPTKQDAPTPWRVELDAVKLFDGLLDVQQAGRRVVATQLAANGDAKVRLEPLEVDGTLELDAALTSPLRERLVARAVASTGDGPQAYDVTASLGETRLRGRAELPSLELTLAELVLAPREVKAFVPAWPLLLPVFGKGVVGPKQASVELRAGRAVVSVDGRYELAASAAESFGVKATDVDLQELVGAELPSTFSLDAHGALSDWRPDSLGGKLSVDATWAAKGQRLATATLTADAVGGQGTVRKLEVLAPGLVLGARGAVAAAAIDVAATLEVDDLRKLDVALRRFAAIDTGGLSGNGALRATFRGAPTSPTAKVLGRLNALGIAGVKVEQLDVDADVPDVTKPLDTDVLLHARRVALGERSFDEVTFDFTTHGRELDLDLETRGLGDLKVHVVGLLDRDSRGARLDTAELTWADASWALEAPTRLAWGDVISLEPFALHDGPRRLSAQLVMTRTKLDATVHAEQLDLAKLPRILAPTSWGLGGVLSVLDVKTTGRPSAPELTFTAGVRGGRGFGLSAVELDLGGAWKEGRATGRVTFGSDAGKLTGDFDVPVFALRDAQPGDARARLEVKGVGTDALERLLGRALPVSGVLDGALELSGTGEHPRVVASLSTNSLSLRQRGEGRGEGPNSQQDATNVTLALATRDDDTLGATLDLDALGGHHHVALDTQLTLHALRTQSTDRDALLALPFELTLQHERLDLKRLAERGGVLDDELAGTVSLTGTVHGPAQAPTGDLALALEQLDLPPLHDAALHLALRADDARTRLTGTGTLSGKPALELTTGVAATPAQVLAALLAAPAGDEAARVVDAVKSSALEGLVVVRPFELAQAFPAAQGETPPGGAVSSTLELGGTLEAPTARMTGTVTNLRFDRVALGSARYDFRSTGTAQSYTLALGGLGRDDFKLKGTTGLDVRLSALRRGLAWREAPVDLSLESRNFDLGFLSGSTDLLRVVAGRLDLGGKVSGTLGAPSFTGDATLTQGRLALAGKGDYRDVELALHATNDVVDVKHLKLRSGAGTAELVAHAERQPSGAFLLTSSGSTEKLSLVNDDQLLATVSLKYALEGDVTAALADVRRLELPRVEVELPEVKRKDLQDLQRPKDIIVLRNGARATKRLKDQAKEAGSAPPSEGFVVRAIIDAPRNIWVRSSDVNIELGLSEGFRVEYRDGTQLFGEARLYQGNLEVIGREFTVQKGSEVRFTGPATKPLVNVSALHTNTREQVKITVTVVGKGTDVSIKPTSEPPMPESDLYAILATGRRTLKNSGSATITPGAAASVVGQLAASQLKTVIAKKLPLDLFNFETSDDFQRVKLDIGWYLSDTLFLGGSVNVGAKRERGENVFSSRLEFQVTRAVTLEAYAGDALSFGADAVWSREF